MDKLIHWGRSHPNLALLAGILLSLILAWLSQPSPGAAVADAEPESIDTYIPAGFVLVPISVYNSESVDSIFGNHGVVDLYPVKENGNAVKWPLARGVKMLRAPKNPSQFGVLVPARAAPVVMSHGGAFQVIIHNPKQRGTVFEKPVRSVRRSIIMEGD